MVSGDDVLKLALSHTRANISELKARQWEVTKWGALANVAWAGLSAQLFKGNDDALTVLWVATLVVTLLCFGSIVFAQIAMLKERRTSNQALEKTPDEEAKKIYGVYGKQIGRASCRERV